jgi:hypothetical protein
MHKRPLKSKNSSLSDKTNQLKTHCAKITYKYQQILNIDKSPLKNMFPLKGDLDEASIIIPSPVNDNPHKERPPTSRDTNVSEVVGDANVLLDVAEEFLECDERLGPLLTTNEFDSLEINFEEEVRNPSVVDPDTLNLLIAKEHAYFPEPYWHEKYQPHLTYMMRAILFDWMMEVCSEFRLKRETFHCATNYVDRYLSNTRNISKSELQLIGVTAMLLASKMEEVYSPKLNDFVKSTDSAYSEAQILEMEESIPQVSTLHNQLGSQMANDTSNTEHVD